MINVSNLNSHHVRVLQEILEHRSRNIEWPDVLSLMEQLGTVVQRHDGKYEFQVGTASAVFKKPHHKDVEVSELVELRRLLTEAGASASSAPARPYPTVVLIDHHHARLFETAAGGAHLEEREHFEPKDQEDLDRILAEGQFEGERAPEAIDYYERLAQRLKNANSIVLIGDATGKSSALNDFTEYLKAKHSEIARRIVGTADADLSSITLPEIERIAQSHA